jgi:hypothetical protein
MQHGYTPAIIKVENRSEYIKSIENAQYGKGLNEFELFITQAVENNLDFFLEVLENNITII